MTTTEEHPFPDGCPWLIQVDSGNPEPDFPSDCYIEVECGAPVTMTHGGDGWACEAGHAHVPIEISWAPYGPEWEREARERFEETGMTC